jgi:hypothetical protein
MIIWPPRLMVRLMIKWAVLSSHFMLFGFWPSIAGFDPLILVLIILLSVMYAYSYWTRAYIRAPRIIMIIWPPRLMVRLMIKWAVLGSHFVLFGFWPPIMGFGPLIWCWSSYYQLCRLRATGLELYLELLWSIDDHMATDWWSNGVQIWTNIDQYLWCFHIIFGSLLARFWSSYWSMLSSPFYLSIGTYNYLT